MALLELCSLSQIGSSRVILNCDVRLVFGEAYGFPDLLEKACSIFHSETLCNPATVVFINLVKKSQHIVTDILSAGTQRLAYVESQVLTFIFSQDLPVEMPNLLEFLRRMNEFIAASKTFNASEAWTVGMICLWSHIHGVFIVGHLLLLVFLNIHESILNKVIRTEWAVDRNLVVIHSKPVHLCILI